MTDVIPDDPDGSGGHAPFAYFSLVGERFDAPGMPADSAREVGYFRDAVVAMARQIYLERNPDRRRVPAGFEQAFDLRLTSVEEGSARPQLALHRPRRRPIPDDEWDVWTDLYADARDAVASTLDIVTVTEAVPPGLAANTRKALKRVGTSLEPEEQIDLGHPTDPNRRASLTETTRWILDEIDDALPPTPVEHTLTGIIIEYDGASLSFILKTEHGLSKCVLERFNDRLAQRARDVLALDGVTAPDVSVIGETLDTERRSVHLFNVTAIEFVRSLEEKVLVKRMERLTELQEGWWGLNSKPPAPAVVDRIQLVIEHLAGAAIPIDFIPSPDGAVVIEWKRDEVEFSASLQPDGAMVLISDNTKTDELHEVEVEFAPGALVDFLERGELP